MASGGRPERLTLAGLKTRGWTPGAVDRFLGEPDALVPNPHYRSGPKMRLYLLSRVEEAERTDEWRVWSEKTSASRQAASERQRKAADGARKKSLNAKIRAARWSTMMSQLEYKTGGNTVAVDPSYTSQRCSECGHIDKRNRESQADFRCLSCGHAENADINAAKNIAARHTQGWAGPASSAAKTHGTPVSSARAAKRKPPVPSSL